MKLFRLLHAASYVLVASQLLFYLAVFIAVLKAMPIESFIEHRKGAELLIAGRLKYIYYACLALSAALVVVAIRQGDAVFTVTSVLAFAALLTDVLIAVNGNIPINTTINTVDFGAKGVDWELLRQKWLDFFRYRGIAIAVGTLSLLAGFLFGKKN